jgi:hypothetical protein
MFLLYDAIVRRIQMFHFHFLIDYLWFYTNENGRNGFNNFIFYLLLHMAKNYTGKC